MKTINKAKMAVITLLMAVVTLALLTGCTLTEPAPSVQKLQLNAKLTQAVVEHGQTVNTDMVAVMTDEEVIATITAIEHYGDFLRKYGDADPDQVDFTRLAIDYNRLRLDYTQVANIVKGHWDEYDVSTRDALLDIQTRFYVLDRNVLSVLRLRSSVETLRNAISTGGLIVRLIGAGA